VTKKLKIWGDPSAEENPFDQLFFSLLRLPRKDNEEAPEHIVTGKKDGPQHLWRLSGMDFCPLCGEIRETYCLQKATPDSAYYCTTCQRLEVRGPNGDLLYSRSFEEEAKTLLKTLDECEGPSAEDDEEE